MLNFLLIQMSLVTLCGLGSMRHKHCVMGIATKQGSASITFIHIYINTKVGTVCTFLIFKLLF